MIWKELVEESMETGFEYGGCTLLIKVDSWHQSNCHYVVCTPAMLTGWGYYGI